MESKNIKNMFIVSLLTFCNGKNIETVVDDWPGTQGDLALGSVNGNIAAGSFQLPGSPISSDSWTNHAIVPLVVNIKDSIYSNMSRIKEQLAEFGLFFSMEDTWAKGKCKCTKEHRPVCYLETKRTFENECSMRCQYPSASLADFIRGECVDHHGCPCAEVYKPVCHLKDNTTFSNTCILKCHYPNVLDADYTDGECVEDQLCVCKEIYKPVCHIETSTSYDNFCFMNCEHPFTKTEDYTEGECPIVPVCRCPFIISPVCYKGEKEYDNTCLLFCDHPYATKKDYTESPCQFKKGLF